MLRLETGAQIGPYRVERFIKDGVCNSNYVVADPQGARFFLKLFDLAAIPQAWLDGNEVREITASRGLSHPNVISYIADGLLTIGEKPYPYLVMQFFKGSLLSEFLQAGRQFTGQEIKTIACFVLDGLVYLHSQGLLHNDITPRNILLEESGDGLIPKLIDLGHACHQITEGEPPFPMEDLNPLFTAHEALDNVFTEASDAFSVAALIYTLICGKAPWDKHWDEQVPFAERKARINEARHRDPI